jgi:hypothetical protein
VIARIVEVAADLERVLVRSEGRILADTPSLGQRNTVTDPVHVETAAWLASSSNSLAPWLPPVTT